MKYIIFDWGGVILREYSQKANIDKYYTDKNAIVDTVRHFNPEFTFDEAYDVYRKTFKDENLVSIFTQNDETAYRKWVARINAFGKINADYHEFMKLFEKNYLKIDIYNDVVDYIYSLKGKARLCLFSDLIVPCYKALSKDINLDIFDYKFLSYDESLKKGNIEAFKNVTNKLGAKPEDILFIDNTLENIENAKTQNWNTCLATGYDLERIKNSVEKFI